MIFQRAHVSSAVMKAQVSTKLSGPHIELGLGISLPSGYRITASSADWDFTVELRARIESFRLVVDELRLARTDEGSGIDADALRAVPVRELLSEGVAKGFALASGRRDPLLDEDPKRLGEADRARRATAIYRLAVLLGEPATEAVAHDLKVSRPTAARAIARARELGYLGRAIPTVQGEEA